MARASRSGAARARQPRLEVTLEGLRQTLERFDQGQLESNDWPLLRALLWNEVARAEGRQERAIAKIVAKAQDAQDGSGKGPETEASSESESNEPTGRPSSSGAPDSGNSPYSGTNETSGNELTGESPSGDSEKTAPGAAKESSSEQPKGHGRNGIRAYRRAQQVFHELASGVLGARCERCQGANVSRYREKIILRIVGQPLFSAEVHHHEQGRCRACGHIVRAQSPGYVSQGLGTDYIRYDWSACAMLMVMHYFGGAPFKRIESLHEGWGVPMPDANDVRHEQGSSIDIIDHWLERADTGAIVAAGSAAFGEYEFLHAETGIQNVPLRLGIKGQNVTADNAGCGQNKMLVNYGFFYEDGDREAAENLGGINPE